MKYNNNKDSNDNSNNNKNNNESYQFLEKSWLKDTKGLDVQWRHIQDQGKAPDYYAIMPSEIFQWL